MWMATDPGNDLCAMCHNSRNGSREALEKLGGGRVMVESRENGRRRRKPKTYWATYDVSPLRAYVLGKDLMVSDLARAVDINRVHLQELMSGKRKFTHGWARKLADHTGLPMGYFTGPPVTIKVTRGR